MNTLTGQTIWDVHKRPSALAIHRSLPNGPRPLRTEDFSGHRQTPTTRAPEKKQMINDARLGPVRTRKHKAQAFLALAEDALSRSCEERASFFFLRHVYWRLMARRSHRIAWGVCRDRAGTS